MGTGASAALVGLTLKQKAEATNFEAFELAHPNFARRRLVSIQWGGDPPDVPCLDATGHRIGVELMQWINEAQMAESKARCKIEDSYGRVIRSSYEQPPAHVGLIFIYAKDKTSLAPANAAIFRAELYRFVHQIDADWPNNPAWDDPQGYLFTDFTGYPALTQHLAGLHVYARGSRFNWGFGAEWITFEAHGGAFAPGWMGDALLDNIRRKITKYAKPENRLKLEQQQLDEFYLLAYYDEAVIHNTPYRVPGFGFREIAASVSRELATNPHPFHKVFLFSPIEKVPVIQVWLVGESRK
jgi:hypothetical protein